MANCIYLFYREFFRQIKNLVGTVGSFKVAGAAFTFGDKKETTESYIVLAEMLIDLLSKREHLDRLGAMLTPQNIERLAVFAARYMKAVGKSDWNLTLLRNIGYLLERFARFDEAILLFDQLLKIRRDDVDLLDSKGHALLNSRVNSNVMKGEAIFESLVSRFPLNFQAKYILTLAKSLLSKHDEAYQGMLFLIDNGYWKKYEGFLMDEWFVLTRTSRPELFDDLVKKLKAAMVLANDQQLKEINQVNEKLKNSVNPSQTVQSTTTS